MTALAVPPRPRIVFRDPIYLGTVAELVTPTLRALPVLDLPWLTDTPTVTVPVLMGRNGRPRGACTLPGYRKGEKPGNAGLTYPPEHLTNDEALRLLTAIPRVTQTGKPNAAGVRNHALITLLWRTGLRISEALALKPHHVDFENRRVHVLRGKGSKARVVGIDAGALMAVQAWLLERWTFGVGADAPLFCTTQLPGRGNYLNARYVRECLHGYGKAAGIPKRVHPHGLRHSLAVSMIRDGFPMAHVMRQLGHANLSTTDIYLRSMGEDEAFRLVGEREWPGQIDAGERQAA